ncbi:SusC/RagA family TonB-linked outer membrane protein [Puia sp.]|uniref:SusC/RagA family TonB-linked outer membrane protein n=1 Tax=Puia sp. TaxID=2045100 RepID=UPI002F403A90
MKLTFLLVFVAALQVSANVSGQGRVSLTLKQVEISRVLNSIEKQGTYRFLYNSRLATIRKKVSVDATDMTISDLLKSMFSGTDLTFKMLENNLIVVVSNSPVPQDIKITGTITGENGEALSGVTVSVKGFATATSTDNNGAFTITAPEKGTLVLSYIGYQTLEVAINSQAVLNVKMTASNKALDEVVVIGYGQASKRDLTGSIVKIDGKEIADKPNINPVASLQSKVAGVYIVNSGDPGVQPDIRIRGTTSIGQVHPLYVVDGILQDDISYLNANDIESLEVLKDPSSLAIFGVRGATGAIVITTKKAKAGQTIINYNLTQGWKKMVDAPKFADASAFKTLYAEELANTGITATPDFSGLNANTNWIDAVTRTANFQTSNLSVSSSTDKNRFNMGLGYTKDQSVVQHIQLDRINISLSDEYKLSKFIRVGANVNVSRTHNPYIYDDLGDPNGSNVLNDARQLIPLLGTGTSQFRLKNLYGTDTTNQNVYPLAPSLQLSGVVNPLLKLNNEYNKTVDYTYRYVASAFAEINFLKYFTWRTTIYGDVSEQDRRQYKPTYYAFNPVTRDVQVQNPKTSVQEEATSIRKFQQDHILTFKSIFDQHSITASGGFTTYYTGNFERGGKSIQGTYGPIPDDPRFWYLSTNYEDPSTSIASSTQYENSTVSWLGRVLYNYAGKYYLTASYRNDGSSQIPSANRYQSFWAVGGGWEVTRENFMANQHVLDFLKIRGSVGVLGNQNTYDPNTGLAAPYLFAQILTAGSITSFGNYLYSAANPLYKPDPDLRWETVHAQEIGFEANALNNRLHFEFNYYNKTTENLMTVINNGPLGIVNGVTNAGSLRNWGEEVTASWTQRLGTDLTLRVSGNITFMKNKVEALSPLLAGGQIARYSQNNGAQASITKAGHPIGYFYGYQQEGIYQTQQDKSASPDASSIGSYGPGDFKFRDVNHNDSVDVNDRTQIGNPSPNFIYGGSIGLTWKHFDLGIDVGGVHGNQIFRTWASLEAPYQFVNYAAFQINRWHGPGTSNKVPQVNSGERFNYVGSSYNIESGSYFRIRNVQLAYNFDTKMLSKASIKNLRVFVNVQNPKTWRTNHGFSPEAGGDATSFGVDYGKSGSALPMITSVGLNVTF